MQQTLESGKIGSTFIIQSIKDDWVASKLMTMGIRVGGTISILRKTWLGKAVCVKSEGIVIALRVNEASSIVVEPAVK